MSVHGHRHSAKARASLGVLCERVTYISNPDEASHHGKTIHPARNYLCEGEGADAFVQTCLDTRNAYHLEQQHQSGRKTNGLFDEYVYCSPVGVALSAPRRVEIEERLAQLLCPYSPCRVAWHEYPGDRIEGTPKLRPDPKTQQWDLHILVCGIALTYPLLSTRGARGSDVHTLGALDAADVEITDMLNRWFGGGYRDARTIGRDRIIQKRPQAAVPLYEELATKMVEVTRENIKEVVESLGHEVRKVARRTIRIVFSGMQRVRQFRLARLMERTNFEIKRRREKRMLEESDDSEESEGKAAKNISAPTPNIS